jgi:hypothetical protein
VAVELFGSDDKPALVVGIIVMSLRIGAVFGVVAAATGTHLLVST